MWILGFKNFLLKVLELFGGSIESSFKNMKLVLLLKNDDEIVVYIEENETKIFHEIFSLEQLYKVLVPNHKLDLLYFMQDVIEAVENQSQPLIVKLLKDELLQKMYPAFKQRMKQQQKEEKQAEIPLKSERFIAYGKEYEQVVFAL